MPKGIPLVPKVQVGQGEVRVSRTLQNELLYLEQSLADNAMVEFDQTYIFSTLSSIGVAALSFPWYRSSHPDP